MIVDFAGELFTVHEKDAFNLLKVKVSTISAAKTEKFLPVLP